MQIISSDDYRPLHLHLLDGSRQNPPADGNISGKRAFLIDVGPFDGLTGRLESQTDVPHSPQGLRGLFGADFLGEENVGLFLKSLFHLFRHPGVEKSQEIREKNHRERTRETTRGHEKTQDGEAKTLKIVK